MALMTLMTPDDLAVRSARVPSPPSLIRQAKLQPGHAVRTSIGRPNSQSTSAAEEVAWAAVAAEKEREAAAAVQAAAADACCNALESRAEMAEARVFALEAALAAAEVGKAAMEARAAEVAAEAQAVNERFRGMSGSAAAEAAVETRVKALELQLAEASDELAAR